MKLTDLFNTIEIQNALRPTNGASAIFEGTKSYSQHALNDMVEDHLPENTRVWKIQWVMSEDGNDNYRPQFIFARTKDEAAHKFTERMRHPSLGLVAIESIIEVPFNSINEGDVIQFPGKKKEPDYIPPYTDFSDEDAHKWANCMIEEIKKGLQHGEAEEYGVESWIDDLFAGSFPYDGTGRAQRMIIKVMLSHSDMSQIDSILKRKYNYNLPKILFSNFNELQEGEVISFPTRDTRSDSQKYDMAAELQRIDKESEWRPTDLTINADPTKEEMQHVMIKNFGAPEIDEFDYAAAMYWFASDFHGGQSSNLYSALSTSEYNPGPMISKIEDEDEMAQELYFTLYDYFSRINEGDVIRPFPDKMLWSKKARDDMKDKRTNTKKYKDAVTKQRGRHRIDWAALTDKRKVDPIKEKKKKKKKKSLDGGWNKAEEPQFTKYDPPGTKYGKNISARRGFVGG